MNDVPLVNKNDINSINTSLIAIKKQLTQLNEAVGLIDVPDVDLTPFVRKDEVVDVIESGNMNPVTSNAVVPSNTVTSGDMHAVTSNAVSQSLSYSTEEVFTGSYWIDGKPIYRKTFYFATVPVSGTVLVTNVDKCIDSGGTQRWSDGNYFEFPYLEGGGSSRLRLSPMVNESNNNLWVIINNASSNVTQCYWWVEYTKITD